MERVIDTSLYVAVGSLRDADARMLVLFGCIALQQFPWVVTLMMEQVVCVVAAHAPWPALQHHSDSCPAAARSTTLLINETFKLAPRCFIQITKLFGSIKSLLS